MIPKVIHCVWLSGSAKPREIRDCMSSWKKVLPDYRIREWTMQDFPADGMPDYVREALQLKKWAFATDYLRLWVLYHEGGVYLDSDVLIERNIDEFLDNQFFSFIEYHMKDFEPYRSRIDPDGRALVADHIPGFCMQAAFMGAEKGNGFVRTCMEAYKDRHFLKEDGSPDMDILAPDIYALCARRYGFRYKDVEQRLEGGMTIYPSSYVAGARSEAMEGNYAVHCCAGSWREQTRKQKLLRMAGELRRQLGAILHG